MPFKSVRVVGNNEFKGKQGRVLYGDGTIFLVWLPFCNLVWFFKEGLEWQSNQSS